MAPLDYTIAVVPDIREKTFSGTEVVRLEVRSAVITIIFNSLNEKLSDVRLDGGRISRVATDDARQLTTLTLARPVAPGMHTLSFSYSGKVETQPHGLFVQTYLTIDGSKRRLLSTKMESTDARRMFPCWDEPAFRSSIELTVTVPAAWATVSNMPIAKRTVQGDEARVTFQRSPRMPTYLIEFSAGDLAAISSRLGAAQLIFLINLFWSMKKGTKASDNPWEATTLEWTTATPPPHDNFGGQTPVVYHGPYEYSVPGAPKDYVMQTDPATVSAH